MACEAHDVGAEVGDGSADQRVAAQAAIDQVVAVTPVESIALLVSTNVVPACRSNDVLDADQGIDRGLDEEEVRRAARPKLGGGAVGTVEAEPHRHVIEGIARIGRVEEEISGVVGGIGPALAIERIIAPSTGEHVVVRRTRQRVVKCGACLLYTSDAADE